MSLSVVLRADASVAIGTGHVMRCLTLARALRARGHDCRFICRDLPGHLGAHVTAEGFALSLMPAPAPGFAPTAGDPAHAAWAGVAWDEDAAQTLALAERADLLVVDHYAFDARWENAARPRGARLMVLDDLADRPHAADLLLDQNLGRKAADYDGLVPDGAERLIGPRYALLRPEFAAARAETLAARAARGFRLKHVLVTMGGVDLPNATGKALSVLKAHPGLDVTVVMGAGAPALGAVRAEAAAMPNPAQILVNVTDMAALMARADLAIGAAGGTAWEHCALGLPSLVAVLADNQVEHAEALSAAGAGVNLGRADAADFSDCLARALDQCADPVRLQALSRAAASVADGKGATRTAGAVEHPVALRPATLADAEPIWHWRRALPPDQFRAGQTPPLPDHLVWFERALADPSRHLFVAGDPIEAHLRLDVTTPGTAAVSIVLEPSVRGRGLAPRLICRLADKARAIGLGKLSAEVHPLNEASLALFRAAGFTSTGRRDGFETFALSL